MIGDAFIGGLGIGIVKFGYEFSVREFVKFNAISLLGSCSVPDLLWIPI